MHLLFIQVSAEFRMLCWSISHGHSQLLLFPRPLLKYLQRTVADREYKHWKCWQTLWIVSSLYNLTFRSLSKFERHYAESLTEIASLRTYFVSKTHFSEHHSWNFYKVYYTYNVYLICRNDSRVAADGALNIHATWQPLQVRLMSTWPLFSCLLSSPLALFGLPSAVGISYYCFQFVSGSLCAVTPLGWLLNFNSSRMVILSPLWFLE